MEENSCEKDKNLEEFKTSDIETVYRIGSGGFGAVYSTKFKGAISAMKMIYSDRPCENSDILLKEARIMKYLNSDFTIKFHAICYGPKRALMMEFCQFDFNEFGFNYICYNLYELMVFLDRQNMESFERFPLIIAKDITRGLKHLHENNIAHLDIKLNNILVSNRHYSELTNPHEKRRSFQHCQIISKLADFGGSKSKSGFECTSTGSHQRSSGFSPKLIPFKDLLHRDVALLAIVFFSLVYPDSICFAHSKTSFKYYSHRIRFWSNILNAYSVCTLSMRQRISLSDVLTILVRPNEYGEPYIDHFRFTKPLLLVCDQQEGGASISQLPQISAMVEQNPMEQEHAIPTHTPVQYHVPSFVPAVERPNILCGCASCALSNPQLYQEMLYQQSVAASVQCCAPPHSYAHLHNTPFPSSAHPQTNIAMPASSFILPAAQFLAPFAYMPYMLNPTESAQPFENNPQHYGTWK